VQIIVPNFLWVFLSTFAISAIAVIAILGLYLKERFLNKILLILVGLSAGAMMGGAFLHLIPEAVEEAEGSFPYLLVIAGFVVFFLIERVLHWRHCHKGKCNVHSFGYVNIIGDSIHNFLDGIIIATSFTVSFEIGIITTIVVASHEIPQEIGDFGVLVYAGFKKGKALALNYLAASTVILGGVIGFYLSEIEKFVLFILPLAAGGFIYIAASDLIPEIKKEESTKKIILPFIVFLLGIGAMYLLTFFE